VAHLPLPLRCTRPRKVFVADMSDLFYSRVPTAWVKLAYAVAALCPHHTIQILTKRADRMLEWNEWLAADPHRHLDECVEELLATLRAGVERGEVSAHDLRLAEHARRATDRRYPVPNLWQ